MQVDFACPGSDTILQRACVLLYLLPRGNYALHQAPANLSKHM